MTEKNMYVCPDCGSALVEYSTLVGGEARCGACEWQGPSSELLAVAVHGNEDQVFQAIRTDLRSIFAKTASEWALFLGKWGFVPQTGGRLDTAVLTKYLTHIAGGVLEAIFRLRQELEKERVRNAN